jgi:hypothetical protein
MSEKFRNSPKPEASRYSRETIEKPVACMECGSDIQSGESALKLTIYPEDTDGLTKAEIKELRTFNYYHSRCVPRDTSDTERGQDALDSWRRIPGSFEGGKRR